MRRHAHLLRRLDGIEDRLKKKGRKHVDPGSYSISWLRSLLPSYFPLPSPPFHDEIASLLGEERRLVISAPRGASKSTVVTLGYPLYCLLFRNYRYIVIVSDTFGQATRLLNAIHQALEEIGVAHTSSASRLIVNGQLVEALGAGCRIRGRRWGKDRPNLIIVDDPQGHLDLISETARESRWDWFLRDLVPAGSQECQYIVVGTTIHEHSIVHRLREEWPSVSYSALKLPENMELWKEWWKLPVERRPIFLQENKQEMERGAHLLWPERWSLESLMEMYYSLGEDVFRSEYLQEPGLGTHKPLFADLFQDRIVDRIPEIAPCLLISIDPAYSTKRSADFCALTSFFLGTEGELFIHGEVIKGDWLSFAASKILERRPRKVVVEANASLGQAAQLVSQSVADCLAGEPWFPDISSHYWTSVDNKHRRIVSGVLKALSPHYSTRISRDSSELLDELRYYPGCKHDDALDSLVLGLRHLQV